MLRKKNAQAAESLNLRRSHQRVRMAGTGPNLRQKEASRTKIIVQTHRRNVPCLRSTFAAALDRGRWRSHGSMVVATLDSVARNLDRVNGHHRSLDQFRQWESLHIRHRMRRSDNRFATFIQHDHVVAALAASRIHYQAQHHRSQERHDRKRLQALHGSEVRGGVRHEWCSDCAVPSAIAHTVFMLSSVHEMTTFSLEKARNGGISMVTPRSGRLGDSASSSPKA